MAAISAGRRKRKVLVLDHANKVGKKILMSGGGRCNFTNLDIQPENYISHNPHFCKSALSRYSQWDFIDLVEQHNIAYHEKTLGQLFCDGKSKQILNMLLDECSDVKAQIKEDCSVKKITKLGRGFQLETTLGNWQCESLVVATGGLSIPKMGATGFGYEIAKQFDIKLLQQSAGLVPLTLIESMKNDFIALSGTSVNAMVECNGQSFRENILFTHRGLSGPAILQISNYWNPGDTITIDLLPGENMLDVLEANQSQSINTLLNHFFTKKLSLVLSELWFKSWLNKPIAELSKENRQTIANQLQQWSFKPNGSEGYRTAEVTKGGVDTAEVSSKTFESHQVKGLYFLGEVLDVTAHLGGYNFQWAWSSGYAAGQYV